MSVEGQFQSAINTEEIFEHIRTHEDAGFLREGADILESGIYQMDPALIREKLQNRLPPHIARLLDGAVDSFLVKKNTEALHAFVESLRSFFEKVETLRLELAFEPTGKVIDEVSAWVKKEIGSDVVLDFGRDLSLRGGSRIIFRGKFTEKSLGSMIARYLEKDKENIRASLRQSITVRNQ